MKKEKQTSMPENESIHQWQKRFALGKRRELREKQKENAELERQKIFEEKTSRASEKKAPYTLRTKAYYRFSKEYPAVVDENGFRANEPGKATVKRRRFIVLAVCLTVFCLSFVFTETLLNISRKPLPEKPKAEPPADTVTFKAMHFSYDILKEGDTEKMLADLKSSNCNAAVFEYKDDTGYVMFNTGSFMGISADRRIPTAPDTVKTLKNKGITVCAYISCFKDSAASRADLSFSVRQNTAEGANWLDNSGTGWLNPFSEPAKNYVLDIISNASEDGFDRIILGNVCFSPDSGSASKYYSGEEGATSTRNQILCGFIANAVKNSGKAKVTVMGTYPAFVSDAPDTAPEYFGNLLACSSTSLCIDARLSVQKKNITVGEENFSDASLMPFVFVLAASEYAEKAVKEQNNDIEMLVCIERGEKLEEQISAVKFARADGYIIW